MRYLTILILLVGFTTAHAQSFELLPKHDTQKSNFYMQANENSFAAGFQFLGITAGVTQERRSGQDVTYIDARITPEIVSYGSLSLIAGVGGATGYNTNRQIIKSRWNAIAGLRFKSVEVTASQFYHFGDDYSVPVTVRWYMD